MIYRTRAEQANLGWTQLVEPTKHCYFAHIIIKPTRQYGHSNLSYVNLINDFRVEINRNPLGLIGRLLRQYSWQQNPQLYIVSLLKIWAWLHFQIHLLLTPVIIFLTPSLTVGQSCTSRCYIQEKTIWYINQLQLGSTISLKIKFLHC